MHISFCTDTAARTARAVFEGYGYAARQVGRELLTDCPPLLAVPTIERRIGFGKIEWLNLAGCPTSAPEPVGDKI